MGQVWFDKWYRDFPVILVGMEQEEITSDDFFPESFHWNELYHLTFKLKIPVFHDKW